MDKRRTDRLNSLLKEVISEVIHCDLHHLPFNSDHVTIMRVEVTADLSYAKVFVSILVGTDSQKQAILHTLQGLAGKIAVLSSKKMVIRFFPELTFVIDSDLEKQLHMQELLEKIAKEREARS